MTFMSEWCLSLYDVLCLYVFYACMIVMYDVYVCIMCMSVCLYDVYVCVVVMPVCFYVRMIYMFV